MYRHLKTIALLGLALSITACSMFGDEEEIPLEGERISVLELEQVLEPDDAVLEAQGLIAPAPWKNSFWPQSGGYPNHSMQNLDLSPDALTKIWSVSIGSGSSDEIPLTASPVLVDGEIFTLDSKSHLRAFNIQNGKQVWETNIDNKEEDDHVISGGISYASGVLYVANGYNEILAVHPANGEIFWRTRLPAPSRAAPTVLNGRLYVTTLDNRLLALNAKDGSTLWEHQAFSETASLLGAASPAANYDVVIPAFSSGEITALRVENGSVAWSDNLSNLKKLGGLSGISDIRALPVIDKGIVFAISFGGRMVAIDERTGSRIWQREIGSGNTPWVAGNHVFVLTTENQLVALGRETGSIRWVKKIENEDRDPHFFMSGPIMAGGRLILAGKGGLVLEIDPNNGDTIRSWDAGGSVAIPPIVAGGVLYLLSEKGKLTAYK
ncbi:MAG: PQQ-binding-like beta-propeller repeat protein [Alphaproteobacteria bacterium]|nr:PQQ-binding-like beta-propeller repeat protein [Alphaproteobacteria bacterium]